jgi:tetratricopeptide (TPR) repeat protein
MEQKHSGIGDNVVGDKHEHYYENKKNIPKQLSSTLGNNSIIGRSYALKKIHILLKKNSSLCINGIGGIGKSTIASNYLHCQINNQKEKLDYYGFFEGLDSFINEIEIVFQLKIEQGQDRLLNILNELKLLEGQKLLIIDNIKNTKKNQDTIEKILELSKNNNYKILMTSREKIEDIESYYLNVLNFEDAKKLFKSFYKKKVEDESLIENIVKYLDYHTLFIELTAKTLSLKKRTLSLEKIVENFSEKKFTTVKRNDIKSYHKFLDNFSINDIVLNSEENLLFIKKLSILPSIEISFENLYKFLVCDDKDKLEEFLIILVSNGWLIEFRNGYKFHQILQDYILEKHTPSFKEIETICKYFFNQVSDSANLNITILNRENLIYYNSIYQVIKRYKNTEIAFFYMNLGNIYRNLAVYKKALFFGKLSIKILKLILHGVPKKGEDSKNISLHKANFYNNLSQTYYQLGSYKKVFILDKKVLNIRKSILGEKHISTIQAYHNLAQLNFSCGNITEAKKGFRKATKLIKKLKEIQNQSMYINEKTVLYSNYAIFLSQIESNHKSAVFFAKEAIDIYEKEYDKIDSNLATFYYHLAMIYESNKEYIKAKVLYENVLQIKIDTFGEEHNDVATAYMGLATFYVQLNNKDCSKSIEYINKALNIYKKIYMSEKHQAIALCYDNLGSIYNKCKEYNNANKFSLKALILHIELLGEEHYKTIQTYLNVVISYYMLEKYIEALTHVKKIIELKPTSLDEFDTKIITSLVEIIPSNDKVGESLIREIGEIINKIKT